MIETINTEIDIEKTDSQVRITRSSEIDIIAQKYKIITDKQITDLNTEFSQYYIATSLEDNEEFFAIAFTKSFTYSFNIIKKLISFPNPYLILPLEAEIVQLSHNNEWRFVVIVPKYEYSNTLEYIVSEEGALSENIIYNSLIHTFNEIFQYTESKNIQCGNINPSNIIYHNGKFVLREFFTQYQNFFQDPYLLPIELFDCVPYARVTHDSASDTYAFGATLVYSYLGKKTWLKYTEEQFKEFILDHSSFSAFVDKSHIPDNLKNLLKGLLYDHPHERWKGRGIREWVAGKASKMTISSNIDAISPISFNDKSYSGCKHLARGLFLQWHAAQSFVMDLRLSQWIQRNVSKVNIIDNVTELLDQIKNTMVGKNNINEYIFKLIMALDSSGPLRLRQISISYFSIPQLLMNVSYHNLNNLISLLNDLLTRRHWEFASKCLPEYAEYQEYTNLLEDALVYYTPELGMNLERMVYACNPQLPCLSENLEGSYVTNTSELISALDEISFRNPDLNLVDKHITSFTYDRIGLQRPIGVKILQPFPDLLESPVINALLVLILAQDHSQIKQAPNLSKLFAQRLEGLINKNIYNRQVREMFAKDLHNSAADGSLKKLLHIICNTSLLKHDKDEYKKALSELSRINAKIRMMKNEEKIEGIGLFFGFRFTVVASYFILFIIFLTLVLFSF